MPSFWLVVMTGVNYLGVRLGGGVQVFLTVIKVVSVVIVIAVAFLLPGGATHAGDPIWPSVLNTGLLSACWAKARFVRRNGNAVLVEIRWQRGRGFVRSAATGRSVVCSPGFSRKVPFLANSYQSTIPAKAGTTN